MFPETFLQVSDEGAAAKEAVSELGRKDVQVLPAGGAAFTHWDAERNFLRILKRQWYAAQSYGSVTIVWAGNDLTGRYAAEAPALEQAVTEVVDSCRKWDVPLRLFDVVGGSYLV